MALDPRLLEILACPQDKGPLLYFADEQALYNPRLQRRYLIQQDIPNMLIDESELVESTEHQRLLAKAEALASPVAIPAETPSAEASQSSPNTADTP